MNKDLDSTEIRSVVDRTKRRGQYDEFSSTEAASRTDVTGWSLFRQTELTEEEVDEIVLSVDAVSALDVDGTTENVRQALVRTTDT